MIIVNSFTVTVTQHSTVKFLFYRFTNETRFIQLDPYCNSLAFCINAEKVPNRQTQGLRLEFETMSAWNPFHPFLSPNCAIFPLLNPKPLSAEAPNCTHTNVNVE